MNESCHTYHHKYSDGTHMKESCHTYLSVMSHIWTDHVTYANTDGNERGCSRPTATTPPCTRLCRSWLIHMCDMMHWVFHACAVCVAVCVAVQWCVDMCVQWFVDMRAMIFSKTDGDYDSVREIIQVVTYLYVHYSVNCGLYVYVSFHMCDTIIGYRRLWL